MHALQKYQTIFRLVSVNVRPHGILYPSCLHRLSIYETRTTVQYIGFPTAPLSFKSFIPWSLLYYVCKFCICHLCVLGVFFCAKYTSVKWEQILKVQRGFSSSIYNRYVWSKSLHFYYQTIKVRREIYSDFSRRLCMTAHLYNTFSDSPLYTIGTIEERLPCFVSVECCLHDLAPPCPPPFIVSIRNMYLIYKESHCRGIS
jgi:hypothetical protein